MTDWTKLNAYVDGALKTSEAAEIAGAAAKEARLARKIATLQRLRESVQAARPALPPAFRLEKPAFRPRALAACLAGLLALAVSLAALGPSFMGAGKTAGDQASVAAALALHEDWAAQAGAERPPPPEVLLASLQGLRQPVWVPDLSDARLTLVHARLLEAEGLKLLHIGYRGTRGCRLSLFAFPAAGSAAPPPVAETLRAASWKAGPLSYLLLAAGMEEGHFALVARTVERATREQAPLDSGTRLALAGSRAASAPCRA